MENLFVFFITRRLFISSLSAVSNMFTHQLRQSKLYEMGSFLAHLSMAITNSEVMPEITPIQVGTQNERILVLFVRVIRDETHSRRESILGYDVSFDELRFHLTLSFTI